MSTANYLSASTLRALCVVTCLSLLTAGIFRQVYACEFTLYDDPKYVTENSHVSAGVTRESVVWAFRTPHGGTSYWHPLTWLSHMLDCELFGKDAAWHHMMNLLLHIGNTVLLFVALARMTNAPWRSAWIAAAFALHPCHVESVAWIAERKDLLSTFFVLLTLLAYCRYVSHPGVGRYSAVVIAYILALMSKPMVVIAPCLLLLLDYWPLERVKASRARDDASLAGDETHHGMPQVTLANAVKEKIPLFVLAGLVCLLTLHAQRDLGVLALNATVPLTMRIANALTSYLVYIQKLLWPSGLAVYYPYRPLEALTVTRMMLLLVLLISVSVCFLRWGRTRRYLITGWFWYLLALLPVIGIIQSGDQAMANRYTYFPYVGLFVLLAWGSVDIARRFSHGPFLVRLLSVAALIAMSASTSYHLRHWHDSFVLFDYALRTTADNYIAHHNLACLLREQGKHDEATAHESEAARIKPEFWPARYCLGHECLIRGDLDSAQEHLVKALKANPHLPEAREDLMRVQYALSTRSESDKSVVEN